MYNTETIAAISTGLSTSGIGIIRISGDDSFNIASKIFRNSKKNKLDNFESHKVYYGYIYDDEDLIDEVLLIPLKSPNSFTKEDTIEINCHGGILIMRKILKLVISNGARLAEPGEFTKKAFLNGRIDLSEAEAVIDLINSKNDICAKNSIKQLTGKLFDKISNIREKLIYEIAFIESALDDPEHISLEGYPENLFNKLFNIKEDLLNLSSSFNDGRVLSEGINTVIVGKPNVGKSSLLNLLMGEDRAIVTDIAGTTRDALSENINIGDLLLNITDTAGIHDTNDIIEKIGVEKSIKYLSEAELVLMVVDSSIDLSDEDIEILDLIKDKNAIILLNKCDLLSKIDINNLNSLSNKPVFKISAKEYTGINEFKSYIKEMFIKFDLDRDDDIFITNDRHKILLDNSVNSITEVLKSIELGMPEDFYSIDLTNAYESLGKIIGENIEDDVVNEIFSKFCMGK